MKKIIILYLFFLSALVFPQSNTQRFYIAMEAFNQGRLIESYTLFENFIKEYKTYDELYAEAKFYSSESLFFMKQYDNAAAGYQFFLTNYTWSIYQEQALFRLLTIYFEKKQYTKATEYIGTLMQKYPNTSSIPLLYYLLGEINRNEHNIEQAIINYQTCISIKNKNKYLDKALFGTGLAFEEMNDYESALKYYDTLLTFHKNSALIYQSQLHIGLCYFKLKDYQSSIIELNSPILSEDQNRKYEEGIYLLANSYYKAKEYIKADKIYNELLEKFPNSNYQRKALYGLAWTKFQEGNFNYASQIFADLASKGFDTISVNSEFRFATCKRYNNELDDAKLSYINFIHSYPADKLVFEANLELGIIEILEGNLDKAELYLIKAKGSEDPELSTKIYVLTAEIKLKKNQPNEALNLLKSADRISTLNSEIKNQILFGIGVSYYMLKNYDQSYHSLSVLSSRDPNYMAARVNYFKAECLINTNKNQDALNILNNLESSDASLEEDIVYSKGYAYLNIQDYDTAEDIFSEFLKNYPNSDKYTDVQLRLADAYYGNKNLEPAVEIYKEVLSKQKGNLNNPKDYYQYAEILYRAGKSQEAFNQIDVIEKDYPNSDYAPRAAYLRGWIYFKQDNNIRAIESYKSAISKYKDESITPQLFYSIGDAYYNEENYDSAIVFYKKVIVEAPNSYNFLDAITGIQYSYEALGEPNKAAETIDEYLNSSQTNIPKDQLLYKKAEILFNAKLYQQAINNLQEYISLYPKNKQVPEAYYQISKSYQSLGNRDKEITFLNYIIDNYSKSESALNSAIDLVNYYNSKKQYDSSTAALDKVIETNKDNSRLPEIIYLKAETLNDKGDIDGAVDVYVSLMQNYQNSLFNDKAMFQLALIQLTAKQFDIAEKYFSHLGETRDDELGAMSQFNYGITLLTEKKYADAATAFEKTVSKFSNFKEWSLKSSLKSAEAYAMLKDKEKARSIYKEIIKKHPKDIYGKEAARKLEALK